MDYDEYRVEVERVLEFHPYWRHGQAAFNVLWDANQRLANEIHSTKLDPFHRDDRLDEFYEYVETNW